MFACCSGCGQDNRSQAEEEIVQVNMQPAIVDYDESVKKVGVTFRSEVLAEDSVKPPAPEDLIAQSAAAPQQAMTVVFAVPGQSEKEITFTRRPLGLQFSKKDSLVVQGLLPGSHGEDMGVKAGWAVSKINGEDMSGKKGQDLGVLLSRFQPVMQIEFVLPGQETRMVTFSKTPLGLDFDKKVPVTMKRVHSGGHGAELGVQAGWLIGAINGQDVKSKDVQYVYELLRSASSSLQKS